MFSLDNLELQFALPFPSKISLSLSAQPGDIYAITGKSGVGKSTLLLTIAGFVKPDKGDMSWQRSSFSHHPVWQRPVSCLFQSDNLFGHLSLRRNILLGAPKKDSPAEKEHALFEICKSLDIMDIIDKPASEVSGGQQQRAALARSLLSKKPILLLDEPFSALDRDNRLNALSLVQQVTKQHQLVTIIVTHDEDDIEQLEARSLRLQREPIGE